MQPLKENKNFNCYSDEFNEIFILDTRSFKQQCKVFSWNTCNKFWSCK